MRKYFKAEFWDYALERALKTAAQALIAGGIIGGALLDIDFGVLASVAGGTILLSFVTSFLAYKEDEQVYEVEEYQGV